MSKISHEFLIFIADNTAQAAIGIPIDLRPMNIAAFAATYQLDANAPTLYHYDRNGHMIPNPGSPIDSSEQAWINEYNSNFDN